MIVKYLDNTSSCFNRYMVECEYRKTLHISTNVCVLIDTWWNVNIINLVLMILDPLVLIDTWWNVNFTKTIVFCKHFSVLIDTWWNVNV